MNSSPFEYLYLDEYLTERATDLLSKRESLAVLGYRNSGKTALINEVLNRLDREGIGPLIKVDFLSGESVETLGEVRKRIADAVGVSNQSESGEGCDALLPILQLESAGVPILAALNIDTIQPSAARRLLHQIRTRVNEGVLAVILTGQHDLRHLVHGDNSPFNCTYRWVLQGLGRDAFCKLAELYAQTMAIEFDDPASVHQFLWDQIQGNAYLLKGVFWLIVERKKKHHPTRCATLAGLRIDLEIAPIFGMRDLDAMRLASRLIGSDPKCWRNLIRLIDGKDARLREPMGVPGSLTLTGISIRREGSLQFASPLMEKLVRRYYDRVRLGDLYARHGSWGRAFSFYRQSLAQYGEDRLRRPVSLEEKPDVELVVRALCSSFYRLARTRRLAERLARGLRFVLGFRVSLWSVEGGQLTRVPIGPPMTQRALLNGEEDAAIEVFGGETRGLGVQEVKSDRAPYVSAHLLETITTNRRLGILIHNLDTREPAHLDRWTFCARILDDFVRSYRQTLADERRRTELAARRVFQDVLNTIIRLMGGTIRDVRDAIRSACNKLVDFEYKRVSVCLLTAEGSRIRTVQCAPGEDFEAFCMTDWPNVSDAKDIENLQQWVLFHHLPYIVRDARNDALTNKNIVETLDLDRFVVVPLFHPDGGVAGTIHVERKDGIVPSLEEINGLIDFGRGLVIALEQVTRVTLEQRTLDGIQDPVVIVDAQRMVHYANRHASQLLNISPGWHSKPCERVSDPNFNHYLEQAWRKSRAGGQFTGLGQDESFGAIVTTAVVRDWRDQIVGGFFVAENVTYLMRCVNALDEIAQAETIDLALSRLVRIAAATLNHTWTRLYREVGGKLLGIESSPESPEFIGCQVWDSISRRCTVERKLIAMQFLPGCREEETQTDEGLSVLVITQQPPQEFLWKEEHQVWVDFPLLTREGALGKLSLGCGRDFRPGDFALLQKLCDWLTGLFDAFEQRDRASIKTMERAMADFSHSFDTRFKGLGLVTDRYRTFEGVSPKIKVINDALEEKVVELEELSHGAKKKLRMLQPVFEDFDLRSLLLKLFPKRIFHTLKLFAIFDTFHGDRALLEELFYELLENSSIAGATTAETTVIDDSDWVEIIYRDNGPGVDPEYRQSQIFEIGFSSRPEGEDRGNGHGMGQIKRIVEKHRGTITVVGTFENGKITQTTCFLCMMRFPKGAKDK